MKESSGLEADFWRIFARVLGRTIAPSHYSPAQLPEWDSLRHVELIFEIEEKLGVEVPQEAIAELFSDTDTIIEFLRARITATR